MFVLWKLFLWNRISNASFAKLLRDVFFHSQTMATESCLCIQHSETRTFQSYRKHKLLTNQEINNYIVFFVGGFQELFSLSVLWEFYHYQMQYM